MSKIASFFADENGASAAEYALILAIIGTAIAAAMVALGGNIATAINNAGSSIAGTTT